MRNPSSTRTAVNMQPIHEVSKIIPAPEYWLRKNSLVGSFGVSTTVCVQCACGKIFRNTEFQNHLSQHCVDSKHFLKATLHSRDGVIYACDCGRIFKTVEDLAEHVNVSKTEAIRNLPSPAERLSLPLASAFSAVGHITDDLATALGLTENLSQK